MILYSNPGPHGPTVAGGPDALVRCGRFLDISGRPVGRLPGLRRWRRPSSGHRTKGEGHTSGTLKSRTSRCTDSAPIKFYELSHSLKDLKNSARSLLQFLHAIGFSCLDPTSLDRTTGQPPTPPHLACGCASSYGRCRALRGRRPP